MTEVCSILLKETMLNLILFSNIFFISSRAACENLAEYSKNCIDLGVTDTSRQLLKNECLLVGSQLNATTTEVTTHTCTQHWIIQCLAVVTMKYDNDDDAKRAST